MCAVHAVEVLAHHDEPLYCAAAVVEACADALEEAVELDHLPPEERPAHFLLHRSMPTANADGSGPM